MRKVDINELRKIQIEILDIVSKYCEDNGINYWIDNGTLLGAVRHKGYIPWDDDIDVGMLREDYDKFTSSFNETNNRYKCCTMKNTFAFPMAHAKVMDTDTVLYEPTEKDGIKLSINIDIFVYDNAPSDPKLLAHMYDIRDANRNWYGRRNWAIGLIGAGIKGYARLVISIVLKLVPRKVFIYKIQKDAQRYNKSETGYVGNFTSYTRMICSKDVFKDFIYLEFEGKKYRAPIGYDEWLRAFYGNYLELPPVEERKPHHQFEAYVLE